MTRLWQKLEDLKHSHGELAIGSFAAILVIALVTLTRI